MRKKKTKDLITIASDFVLAYAKRVSELIQLASLEAQLALKTLVVMAIMIFLLSSIVTALFIAILALLFVTLVSLNVNLLAASLVVVGVCVGSLAFVIIYLYKIRENLLFRATCNQLNRKKTTSVDEKNHEKATTKN